MSRRTRVPKFGSWDSSENTNHSSFTEVFEDARAMKGGRIGNPSDPLDNPAAAAAGSGFNPRHVPSSKPQSHSRSSSRENAEQQQRIQVDNSRYVAPQAGRKSGGEEDNNGAHRSPMHQQARRTGMASPAWEKRNSSDGGSATPGRSRLRNSNNATNAAEPADKGAALPKFGAWDANDPASADGFTVIFNNARNEKKAGGSVHVPPLGFDGARNDKDLYPGKAAPPHSAKPSSKLFCCFQPGVAEA